MVVDIVKTICDTGLTCWDCVDKYRKYIRSLDENLKALERKVDELRNVYDDVNQRVGAAEGEGWARTRDVNGWLQTVETLMTEAGKILEDGEKIAERKCLCGICFWNCRPRYKQSGLAEAKKADVEEELSRGRTFRVKEDVAYEPGDLTLKRSVEALRDKMDELRDFFETVKQRVEREEKMYKERTPEVSGWLKRVEGLLGKEAREGLEEGELELVKSRQGVEGDSQGERNSSYIRISKFIDEKRAILEGMLIQGRKFVVFAVEPIDPPMLNIPSESHVGAESVFKEIWNWVEDEEVRCIGLFGMGGVGKTTLLNRVHNHFCRVGHDYNFALHIVVSRPANLAAIQEAILKELKLPKYQWVDLDRTRRAPLVSDLMKEKNFLLFLDDLWDPINLVGDIGIPDCLVHPKKCKIIFTTRDEDICNRMQPDKKKKVECLPPHEALQLFRQKLGEKTWGAHPLIPEIAASLVHECKCLPIALITVAGAMTGKTEPKDWREAENDLKSRLSKFPDMKERVLANLEFSYVYLPDETHKKCFQYLSIFPEDREICEEDVINLWIGEGFLDDYSDDHEARRDGEKIFKRLRSVCLVEFVRHTLSGDFVTMHDVIREMALWVGTEHGLKTNKVLVQEGLESFRSGELRKWKNAERISIWDAGSSLHDSLATGSCSHLSTLIIRGMILMGIPDEFFLATPCLRVLDLSETIYLDDLPSSIWKLTNLRYLNLYGALVGFFEVPVEIKNLNKLVVLILSRNFLLPVEVIPNTSSIRVFCWSARIECWEHEVEREIQLLEKLQMMQSIEEISIDLCTLKPVEKLLGTSKLPSCLRRLDVHYCHGMDSLKFSTSLLRRLKHLQSLFLRCRDLRQVEITREDEGSDERPRRYSYVESLATKPSTYECLDRFCRLRDVQIIDCHSLIDLTSLIYHAPFLETLCIIACLSLKEVIIGDIEDSDIANRRLFPCLTNLHLDHVERLERICRRALPFPALKEIKVFACHKLKELPLNCDNAKALEVIHGQEEWWQELVWNDPASKQVFSAKFSRI